MPGAARFSRASAHPALEQRARRARSARVRGRAGADRQPRAARALFRCAAARGRELLLPAFIDARPGPDRGAGPGPSDCEPWRRCPGVYGAGALSPPRYSSDGQLLGVEPIGSGIPARVAKQTWRGNTLSHSMVITPEAAWPSIHMVEVVRSCPELCRFCLASYLTLPFRTPSLDDGLIPAVEKGLVATQRLGLLGASVTQHPQFADLLSWLDGDRFEDTRVSVSSVRAATVTPQLGRILARRGSKSLTIAIESGSERLRRVVNKKLESEEIFAAARYAKEGGLSGLKLYGMAGLPSETNDDIEATAALLIALKGATPGLRLSLGVSSFVPKAHTPFQWEGVRPEAEKRLKLLAKRLQPKGIALRPESYGWSVIQALLSRSDRRLAAVIAAVRGNNNDPGGLEEGLSRRGRRNASARISPSARLAGGDPRQLEPRSGSPPGTISTAPCRKPPWPAITATPSPLASPLRRL